MYLWISNANKPYFIALDVISVNDGQ